MYSFCNLASDRLDAKWRLTEDANASDSQLCRPSGSVVHDFSKLEDGIAHIESPSTEFSSITRDNSTPKSRLLVFKNDEIFNPMKSRMCHDCPASDSQGISLGSGTRESSISGVGTKGMGTLDITRVDADRESSLSQI